MKLFLVPVASALLLVTACAQPEPAAVDPEPVYDKWGHGGGGCPTGGPTAGAGGGECLPDGGDGYRPPNDTTGDGGEGAGDAAGTG